MSFKSFYVTVAMTLGKQGSCLRCAHQKEVPHAGSSGSVIKGFLCGAAFSGVSRRKVIPVLMCYQSSNNLPPPLCGPSYSRRLYPQVPNEQAGSRSTHANTHTLIESQPALFTTKARLKANAGKMKPAEWVKLVPHQQTESDTHAKRRKVTAVSPTVEFDDPL